MDQRAVRANQVALRGLVLGGLACLVACSQLPRSVSGSPAGPSLSHVQPIVGRVVFPTSRRVQAGVPYSDNASASVTLIDPTLESGSPAGSIATGLTDAAGSFTLDLGVYTPIVGRYYMLEAFKGTNDNAVGYDAVRLRDLISLTGTGAWEGMSGTTIVLSEGTTALSIIESLQGPNVVPPANLMGTINDTTDAYSGSNPDSFDFNTVDGYVNTLLLDNEDPINDVYLSNGSYVENLPTSPPIITLYTVFPATVSVGADLYIYGNNLGTSIGGTGESVAISTGSQLVTAPIIYTDASESIVTVPQMYVTGDVPATVSVGVGISTVATLSVEIQATQSTDATGSFIAP